MLRDGPLPTSVMIPAICSTISAYCPMAGSCLAGAGAVMPRRLARRACGPLCSWVHHTFRYFSTIFGSEPWVISPCLLTNDAALSHFLPAKIPVLLIYFPVQGGIPGRTFPDVNHPNPESALCTGSNLVPIIVQVPAYFLISNSPVIKTPEIDFILRQNPPPGEKTMLPRVIYPDFGRIHVRHEQRWLWWRARGNLRLRSPF